jgi:predicted nucleic acid-binding protein
VAVFVDTGAWFAASVQTDPDHRSAVAFLSANSDGLVTSDYVWCELLTLFRARKQMSLARRWRQHFIDGDFAVISAAPSDVQQATDVFFSFGDKKWSFTDCVSRVMMQRLGIARAFAFDDHFRQFGTVTVLP